VHSCRAAWSSQASEANTHAELTAYLSAEDSPHRADAKSIREQKSLCAAV
jgi:hypothetical protein